MKLLKYTQNVYAYLNLFLSIIIIGLLLLMTLPNLTAAQTNDPKLSQQYYIFDHNIDDAWNINKGSSGINIAIHSLNGFTVSHEDIVGRVLNPSSEWFNPEHGNASEVAGIIGANSNNGVGIAGIDWHSNLKSYNIIRKKQSGDNNSNLTYNFNNQDYYMDLGKLDAMVDEAIQDNMDIQLFTFGVPGGKRAVINQYQNTPRSGVNDLVFTLKKPTITNQYWDTIKNFSKFLVTEAYNQFTSNNYSPPSYVVNFRQKLWEFTQPPNNGVTLAPAGDVSGYELFDTSMPAIFDNYVVTVAGAEKDPLTEEYSQWSNSREGSFVDVSAAAKDIVSLSGTGNSNYTNDFTSTAAAMAITGGVVSLLKAEEPSLTHDDIEEVLKRTALDIEGPGEDNKTGAGFVDAQAAINLVSTNDLVHDTVVENEIEMISNIEISPLEVNLSNLYLNFTNEPSAAGLYGKLRKLTGRVYFDYVFQQPPETWIRMSSSGFDITTVDNGTQNFYDPYDKSFKITSVNDHSFTFEYYYWRVTHYDAGGVEIPASTLDLYSDDIITIDYTAIGQETNLPPEPEISISGLNYFNEGSQGNWDVDINRGQQPYNITWYRRYSSTGPWSQVGTGSSYSQTVTHEMDLKAKVIDADYQTDQDIMHINVMNTGGCSPFPCPQPKTAGQELPTTFALNQNYPNPFNPSTTIKYELSEQADVRLSVYNILGRKVATLVNTSQQAGFYEVKFDGQGLASGLYIARLEAMGNSGTQFVRELKMQMVK